MRERERKGGREGGRGEGGREGVEASTEASMTCACRYTSGSSVEESKGHEIHCNTHI